MSEKRKLVSCENDTVTPERIFDLCELSNKLKAMSEKRKLVSCGNDTVTPKQKLDLCELSNKLKAMSEKRKLVSCENDTVMPERKFDSGAPDVNDSIEPVSDATSAPGFTDMCDDVIDMILCALRVEDLANISDTSIRLRAIAVSVFSRRHAHRLISMDTSHYSNDPCKRNKYLKWIPIYCKYDALVRITDAKVWFKLVRNFGACIKHVRIQSNNFHGISIPNTLAQYVKYISKYCSDTLETLDVIPYTSFSSGKFLLKFQEVGVSTFNFENSEALEQMSNLRALYLSECPHMMARSYAKLERVRLELESDKNVQTFISFARLNPQIKYLRLIVHNECMLQQGKICSSIADNLTQLKILKLTFSEPRVAIATFRFKLVESFSITNVSPIGVSSRHVFEFDDLKKLKLKWSTSTVHPSHLMYFAQRNRKLKILKLNYPHIAFLDNVVIQNVLNELPELEQILVNGLEDDEYPIFKHLLGGEWEQFEMEGTVKLERHSLNVYKRFRRISSKD